MKRVLDGWRSDKLKFILSIFWLLTVFTGFFGSTIFLVKVPGLPALYPFRVLLPITTLLYMVWAVRQKRNPWKAASFVQRVCYVLCAILIVYSTVSLRWAIDFEFTFTLWITLCFNLVFFALALELCSNRKMFVMTVHCALMATVIQIVMGMIEIVKGGFFTQRFFEVFFFFGQHLSSPAVSAGNPNDYSMMLVFMLALMLLYWAWRGHERKFNWVPVVLIAPVYFLIGASYARLCELSFWTVIVPFVMYALTSRSLAQRVLIPAVLLLAGTMAFFAYGEHVTQLQMDVIHEAIMMEAKAALPENVTPEENQLQILPDEAVENSMDEPVLESSGAVRLDLLRHVWNCFVESRGMGVGLGNTAQLAKPTAPRRGGVWAIHCFLARMTADFGIWFLIPLLLIAFKMVLAGIELVRRELTKRNRPGVLTGVMYLASVLIYPIASTAPGDAQNSMPMWLFLGGLVVFPALVQEAADA